MTDPRLPRHREAVRRPRPLAALAAIALLVGAGACASRSFTPPPGPGRPAPEAAERLDQAVARCRGASSYVGVTHLSGRIGDENVPSVRIDVGVTRDGGIALDASAVGRTIFWLSGRTAEATLFLAEDRAVLSHTAPEIVEALVGARIAPDRLLAILTGCISRDTTLADAAEYEDGLTRVTTPDGVLYLRERQGRWQVAAGEADGLTVEIREFGPAFPSGIRIRSAVGATPVVDLRVRTSPPIRVNDTIAPGTFTEQAPADARPITIEDLRAAGPLRTRDGGGSPPRP